MAAEGVADFGEVGGLVADVKGGGDRVGGLGLDVEGHAGVFATALNWLLDTHPDRRQSRY